jgi:hypothetical protein
MVAGKQRIRGFLALYDFTYQPYPYTGHLQLRGYLGPRQTCKYPVASMPQESS